MVSKGVLIFTVLTATCSSQIIRYNINHHCLGGTGGVFECDRLKNERYMLSGENVQVIIFNRVDSDVELIISTTNFKKELNQIKIKVGFCPRLTIRGNIIKHTTIEHANKECQYETSTTTVSRDNKRDKVQISTYQSNHGSTTSINKKHFDSTTMSVNNDKRQTSEHTSPVHSSSATARNDDSVTPVHGSTLTMRNDDSATMTMSGSNEGDKRQTSEYQHTTPVCPGTKCTSTIGDGHHDHEETEKVKTYLVWLITMTACKYNQKN
ncbi:uncharacterized protein LOC127722312 [Mytilus californianus]|uniref:uncharacterized protein LOC127722312 n=1 Tax=Mytilus californianus TaxID=6549 RepID=UPI002247D309|nr:uncharacterized protein LOC127722312 [Mytilus californianus]